ncbi:MAG: HNH endonuclease domain-containing protein [Bacteroidota bacterium]|nr:HNH endonuclease domain-containing protein [Bacteroidota bacterium]MDP4233075.1 HNH endonuclease domain-containing protein [Bacteroidota bacterium]MDP4241780.1 HNH endonuclease domain-containing protein [Bacteroidota bacterium]MDP4289428.1 HNH endonuclease domain-containing protein [Bacteroidota bacterium]
MARTLGLDIGTTSIGWCLMEDKSRIIRSGVRIFPVGVQEDKFAKSATEESKNAARRTARGIRRGYDRYKLRRKQLRRILLELNMLPDRLEMPSAQALYGLRVRGLDQKLELKEIGRVLLHLNQRRGFKSNRKAAPKDGDDETGIKLQMSELKQKVHDLGFRTLGEYYFSLYDANETKENWHNPDEPIERIRKRFVHRSMYEEEFDAIWKSQARFYPDLLTEERRREIKERCIYYQRPLKSQKGRVGKCRFEPSKRVAPRSSLRFQEFRIWETLSRIRVTDATRHLGSLTLDEKKTLASVLAETDLLTVPKAKAHLKLSRAAYFNDIDKIKGNTTASNIIKAIGAEAWQALPEAKRDHIWHVLYFAPDESWLAKWGKRNIGLSDEAAEAFGEISLEPDYSRISHKAIEKMLPFLRDGLDYSEASKAAGYHHSFDEETQGKERAMEDKIVRKPNDEIEQLRNPMVMRAVSETVALVNAIIQEEGRPDQIRIEFARSMRMPKEVREKMRRNNQDKDRQREEYREFLKRRMQWADISRSQITKFELWLEMEFAQEDLRRINASIDIEEFAKFVKKVRPSDKQKYELWLECGRISPYTGKTITLGQLFSAEIEIEHIVPYSKSFDNSFRNKTLCEREFNAKKGNDTPIKFFEKQGAEAVRQFKERIKTLPHIKQERMLQEEFEEFRPGSIESTAMIARATRDVLRRVCRDVRATDGQVTSILRRFWGLNTILNTDGDNEKSRNDHRHHAVDAFVIANTDNWWINLLSQASAFDPHRRLSDNLLEMLHTPAGRELVRAAGLGVSVEADEHDPLSLQYANPATGEISAGGIPGPYHDHRRDLEAFLSGMLISYRNEKRLLTSKNNKYRYSHPKSGAQTIQRSVAIRGALHAESVFGQIMNSHTGQLEYVIRKPLASLDKMKQIEKIVDLALRQVVKDHIERYGGEAKIKEAMQQPMFLTSKDGKKRIPVHSVRVTEPATNLIQLRPKENPKLFVDSGSNYCMAIYGEPQAKKRAYDTIPFFMAAERARTGKAVAPAEKNGLSLWLLLMQKDTVVTFKDSPDEIDWNNQVNLFQRLCTVRKFDVNGIIYLDRHNISKFEDKDRNVNFFQVSPNSIRAVKVELGILGNIKQVP